jgi:hypothetical protein
VRLLKEVEASGSHRALVTVLDEPADEVSDISTALLSEAALAEDWNRSEEDAAWAHLQPEVVLVTFPSSRAPAMKSGSLEPIERQLRTKRRSSVLPEAGVP